MIGRNAEFAFQIEGATTACQLDDIRDIVNGLERGLSLVALNQAQDMFVEHVLPEPGRNGADELIAAQDALDIAIVEDVLGTGQAQRRSGNYYWGVRRLWRHRDGCFRYWFGTTHRYGNCGLFKCQRRRRRDRGRSSYRRRCWSGVTQRCGCRLRDRRLCRNLA